MMFVTACSNSSSVGGGDSETIKIGALFPLSGNLALMGEESFRGVELAVEEINKNGGINGKHIELVKADAVDPDAAQAEANRLINREDITLIVGSYSSGISLAASEVSERNRVLYFELGAVADSITNRGYQYVFRTNSPASYFSKVQIDFIKEKVTKALGKDVSDIKVAFVHEDSDYGTTIAEEAAKLAEKAGMKVTTILPYASTSNDLSSIVLSIKKQNPDVLIAVSYLNDAILLARQSKELGLEVPVIIGSGGGHTMSDFYKAVKENAELLFDVDFPQYEINRESTPGLDKFIEMYKEKYGSDPKSGHSLANYMGMHVVIDIIKQAGSTDPDKVKKAALKYTAKKGTTSTGWGVKFDPKTGQNTEAQPYVHQWINGKLIGVWPESIAVQEPQFK
jgi:branched-chain amino acid transport system substrate-binding protein